MQERTVASATRYSSVFWIESLRQTDIHQRPNYQIIHHQAHKFILDFWCERSVAEDRIVWFGQDKSYKEDKAEIIVVVFQFFESIESL